MWVVGEVIALCDVVVEYAMSFNAYIALMSQSPRLSLRVNMYRVYDACRLCLRYINLPTCISAVLGACLLLARVTTEWLTGRLLLLADLFISAGLSAGLFIYWCAGRVAYLCWSFFWCLIAVWLRYQLASPCWPLFWCVIAVWLRHQLASLCWPLFWCVIVVWLRFLVYQSAAGVRGCWLADGLLYLLTSCLLLACVVVWLLAGRLIVYADISSAETSVCTLAYHWYNLHV